MKRFWKEVSVEQADGGFRVALDGRAVRTQGGAAQLLPGRELTEALAQEWREQGEKIDPAKFGLRKLSDFTIDYVGADRADVIAKILAYAETDTLCYRADPEDALFQRQQELWEPLLSACEARHQVKFERVSGILHRSQPPATLARLGHVLTERNDFELAALNTLASLAASLCVGLAALEADADAVQLFATANCEEDWQAELWGWDITAEQTRALRLSTFQTAVDFARLARMQ